MTPAEIRTARTVLGLTQGQCARLIGVDGRTWRRWETTEGNAARDMPEPVCRLLRLLVKRPDIRTWLETQIA